MSSIPDTSVTHHFQKFRDDLDDHNDRRERIIKASRDITNLSKKIIFLLHRNIKDIDNPATAGDTTTIWNNKFKEVQNVYATLKEDLKGDRYWHYERQVSPGLQEYIEALGFAHYLKHGTLITFSQVQDTLLDHRRIPFFPLTVSDYLLGLSDLTGELMRYSISGMTQPGGSKKAIDICAFVRGCKSDFENFTPFIRDLSKKQYVTSQSLEKIEHAVYNIIVRSSEYDLPPEVLDGIVAKSISSMDTVSYGPSNFHHHKEKGKQRYNQDNDLHSDY